MLPPTVLGFYVLVALGPRGPIGQWYETWIGHGLAFTFEGLVIASTLYSLPFAVQPVAGAFGAVDRRLVEASWTLGVSRWGTFFRVIVPQSWAGLVTGVVLSFAHTLGEFGVVLMVGGNILHSTRVLTTATVLETSKGNFDIAIALSVLLVGLTFGISMLLTLVQQRGAEH